MTSCIAIDIYPPNGGPANLCDLACQKALLAQVQEVGDAAAEVRQEDGLYQDFSYYLWERGQILGKLGNCMGEKLGFTAAAGGAGMGYRYLLAGTAVTATSAATTGGIVILGTEAYCMGALSGNHEEGLEWAWE